jgi:hypothetical protein
MDWLQPKLGVVRGLLVRHGQIIKQAAIATGGAHLRVLL